MRTFNERKEWIEQGIGKFLKATNSKSPNSERLAKIAPGLAIIIQAGGNNVA